MTSPGADDPAAYWEDRLGRQYDLGGVGYQVLGLDYNNAMYRVRARVFRRALRRTRLNVRASRVLDIGSGTGFYVEPWLAAGAQVVATDVTNVAVAQLKERFPAAQVHRLDIGGELDLPERGPFDAVSAFDVLFHIVDDERYARAVANIASLLRPGGWLLYSDNFLHGEPIRTPVQASRALADIEGVVRDAGFEIVRRDPMFVLMNAPVDTTNKRLRRRWAHLERRLRSDPTYGARAGRRLYPLEIALTRVLREGPSTEVMLARKR